MSFVRNKTSGCCGQAQITYDLSFSLLKDHADRFTAAGFSVLENYKKAGLLYAESATLTVSGQFGSSRLKLTCKVKGCEAMTQLLDSLLNNLN